MIQEIISIKVGELKTNCYLAIYETDLIIIDPGANSQ